MDPTNRNDIAARLKEARIAAEYATATEFADKNEFDAANYRRHESGDRGFKRSLAREYALALGVNMGWLVFGEGTGPSAKYGDAPIQFTNVSVIGAVQAGAWREAIEWPVEDRWELPAPTSREYPSAPRFALVVRGDSMDEVYREGTILICVRYSDIPRAPKDGERVIVQRRDSTGQIEATVKRISVRPDKSVWLIPQSSNLEHHPIRIGQLHTPEDAVPLAAQASAGPLPDDADVEVVALVDQSFQFER